VPADGEFIPVDEGRNSTEPPTEEDVQQAPQTFAENKESASDEEILMGKPSEENMREPLTLAKNASDPGGDPQGIQHIFF